MQNAKLNGLSLKYRNTGIEVIPSGALVALDDVVGIATTDIQSTSEGVLHTEGVFILPKKTGENIRCGQRVFWDPVVGAVTLEGTHLDTDGETIVPNVSVGVAWALRFSKLSYSPAELDIPVKINV
jgi:predicted RecA/RadA family phage recombinase